MSDRDSIRFQVERKSPGAGVLADLADEAALIAWAASGGEVEVARGETPNGQSIRLMLHAAGPVEVIHQPAMKLVGYAPDGRAQAYGLDKAAQILEMIR